MQLEETGGRNESSGANRRAASLYQMMGEQQNEARAVFTEALALTAPDDRARYLDAACRDKPELRQRVEALLRDSEKVGEFLKQDALGGALDPPESFITEAPGTVIGHYKLLEQIGEGGFGVVFMAEQTEPIRRRVALKIVKPGMDTKQVIARFEAERQALALMNHPNIAHVFDAGATESGRPYFVMELVQGVPLTRFCDANNLTPQERLKLFMTVCEAVQHAHQKGIIHRDLKPSNILVTLHDGKPVPKVIDFGTAKALQQPLTEKTLFTAYGKLIGTPQYMSPEQAELSGLDVDTRADIYSLGVLLYELLTGTTPFEAEQLRATAFEEMLRIIREEEPPKPSTRVSTLGARATEIAKHRQADAALLRRTLQGDLDWIVMKALEKDRARRYKAASALVEDIQHHLNHEPVRASPPSRVYRAHKFVRRHRLGVAFAAAVVAALALGLVTSLIGFSRARQERDRAVAAEGKTEEERNHAELLAAEAALAEGQSKLEAGDSWGLLNMVEAFDLAKHNPTFQNIAARRWSTWHALWNRRTIAVRWSNHGVHSSDYLQYADVNTWPPFNTSREVHVYDTLTGTLIAGPLRHDSVAWACAFSPDGHLLATVTEKGVIHLWDCKTGEPVRPPCETGVVKLNQLLFSDCGRYLVALSGQNTRADSAKVAFLRLNEPQRPVEILERPYSVTQARFSPDGERLAIMGHPVLQVLQTGDLQPMGPPLQVAPDRFLEFSTDGTRLAFAPQSPGGIALLDVKSQQIIQRLPPGDSSPADCAFSHDGHLLASFDWDCSLKLWRLDSASRPYAVQRLGARTSGRLAFSPDDSLLALGDASGTVCVFRTSDGQAVSTLHTPPFPEPLFLTNGFLAANATVDHFWDLMAEPLPGTILPHDALVSALEFDRTGTFLAIGGEGELRLWTMQPSPSLERIIPMPGRVLAVVFSDAEDQFAAFSDDGSLTMVEPRTGRTTARGNFGRGYNLSACLSPDARKLALFRYYEALVVDTHTGAPEWLSYEGGVRSLAFRRDSQRLAVGYASWKVSLFDTSAQTNVPAGISDALEGWVESVAYHPSGRHLALCMNVRHIRIYQPETKRLVFGVYESSLARVDHLRFSPDGSLLAAAGAKSGGGYGVELWHMDPERGLYRSGLILTCEHPIWNLAFSPDNRTLVAGGLGSTRLWQLPPAPNRMEEVQSRTQATLGFRLDRDGQPVYLNLTNQPVEEIQARFTQASTSSVPALDNALKLPPSEALVALQKLAGQYPGPTVLPKLLARVHVDLMLADAEQHLWTEARANADEAIRLGPDDPYLRYQRALLCLGAGDAAGYRAECQAMVDHYKSSNDPDVFRWVGWAAAQAPGALDDYAGLVEQLQRTLPRIGGPQAPDYRFYLAAVLLRAGRHRDAMHELENLGQRLKTAAADVEFLPTYHELLLAICHAHLGHETAARQCYETGCVNAKALLEPRQDATTTATRVPWNRRLTIRLLQEEAEGLLKASAPTPVPPRSR